MSFVKEDCAIDNNGKPLDLYFHNIMMFPKDWKEAEEKGLVLVDIPDTFSDDTDLMFSKKEDKERAIKWLEWDLWIFGFGNVVIVEEYKIKHFIFNKTLTDEGVECYEN